MSSAKRRPEKGHNVAAVSLGNLSHSKPPSCAAAQSGSEMTDDNLGALAMADALTDWGISVV
jgi:hypothetical protein